jgi:hypothetical protein
MTATFRYILSTKLLRLGSSLERDVECSAMIRANPVCAVACSSRPRQPDRWHAASRDLLCPSCAAWRVVRKSGPARAEFDWSAFIAFNKVNDEPWQERQPRTGSARNRVGDFGRATWRKLLTEFHCDG